MQRTTVRGDPFDSTRLRGPLVIEFFAEWCEPCKRMLPVAERLHREFSDVVILGVSIDETQDAAQRQIARFGLTFPVVIDTSHVLSGRFRVRELPAVFVSDRSGSVVWVGDTSRSEIDLERVVEAARR